MFNEPTREFLFKCEDCAMILAVSFEEEEDLQKVQDNKMILKCLCGSDCLVLRD